MNETYLRYRIRQMQQQAEEQHQFHMEQIARAYNKGYEDALHHNYLDTILTSPGQPVWWVLPGHEPQIAR
jgi:hypothetical protein